MTAPLDSAAVAQYLADHPQFFVEHAGLLGEVKLSSPLTGRAVSLQERQMEVMRDKYKALELRMADLLRRAEENMAIANRFHGWTQGLLRAATPAAMPDAVVQGLIEHFSVPQASLRLWNLAPDYADAPFARGVSDDVRLFANSLRAPYCGPNKDFEAVRWLDDGVEVGSNVRSTVLLTLRAGGNAFGLLVLGSPDPDRFNATMATDFLVHIGETASAALAPLRA
ncbi:DUF484 family protein [Herbaspirillum sp. SJZ107]|uniref:DUF484 family protein n=1 Tax=Herbaspirillum sp. SJZ107 TaxID=2572881 RepID=UPI001151BEFA|nr:DUF484 family protein [Herbaspirillum sp. SJZ107]TQK05150.1 hypothetical protein FBX97_4119 [Herbaspirillum sp. SJZ107]